MNLLRRPLAKLAALAVSVALCGCGAEPGSSSDPLLDSDFVITGTQQLIELLPAVPWLQPGEDGRLGSDDDIVLTDVVGDVDLVVRAGIHGAGAIPATGPLRLEGSLVVEASWLDASAGVPFTVWATDGASPPNPVVSPAVEGNPVLVVAFADLDGDGFVGITSLDGDETDHELEELELDPVGRRFASFSGGLATGSVAISIGGAGAAPVSVVLTAAAYTGMLRPDYFEGQVPDGPIVMTGFPFLPRTDPDRVVSLGGPAGPDVLVGVEVEDEFTPDPGSDPSGEAFTLPTDGSRVSVDVVIARSGPAARFALLSPPAVPPEGRLIPVAGPLGPLLREQRRELSAGASDGHLEFSLHAVDALGNAASIGLPEVVTLRAGQGLRLLAPDADGDAGSESVVMFGSGGVTVVVDSAGAAPVATLEVESSTGLSWLRVIRVDGDADGDGVADLADNCVLVPNPGQADTTQVFDDDATLPGTQRYGDACDRDLDDDGLVGVSDFFAFLRPCLGLPAEGACAQSDLDADGIVGPADFFGGLRPAFGERAGPGTTAAP